MTSPFTNNPVFVQVRTSFPNPRYSEQLPCLTKLSLTISLKIKVISKLYKILLLGKEAENTKSFSNPH